MSAPFRGAIATLVLASLGLLASACTTEAFCFGNCPGDTTTTTSATTTGTGGQGGIFTTTTGSGGTGGDCFPDCTTTGSGGCMPTNEGIEICDGKDNDCDGMVDNGPDIDLASPKTCGTCDVNCYALLTNNDPMTITCEPSASPGTLPGVCHGECASDYFDLDGDELCEYYCVKSAESDALCNKKDDDCDGLKDEDVDLCSSTTDCGKCGGNCVVLHGTPTCAHDGAPPCDSSNTKCAILSCTCDSPADCWWDLDGSYATGCEYACSLTMGGIEVCGDSVDNDCDGKIDEADDLSMDPQLGLECFGDPDGECATAAHAGTTACVGNQVVCIGMAVLIENQNPESCNGKDDDCDGVADDNPGDVGMSCGVNNIFPCAFGTLQCANGVPTCVGAINPGTETCNGIDDDCDGTIDKSAGMSPPDAVGACNVPLPPPAGASSPCKAGALACVGGTVQCVGSIGPSGASDGCNVDANCDGALTNQPNKLTDINNCGACGNSCTTGAIHANFACVNGSCQFQSCQPNYYDLDGNGTCEYFCAFLSAQEACNGLDDNCNGQTDEGNIPAPTPKQVCGVSPGANAAECNAQVSVTCQNGGWVCGFPAGVCSPSCAQAAEICDALDNDCDGLVNENVANFGKPCASDDGLAPPGHGACRTQGSYVCNGVNAVICSAVKANCANLPGGCTELCDGVDNDCDGLIDEPFTNKGANAANYVRPAVTRIANGAWMTSYEVSRPSATSSVPGGGNGYYCAQIAAADPNCNDASIPLAPVGVPLDKTTACSVPGVIPWFNVTPIEAEQTCKARGGRLCTTAEWQTGCTTGNNCSWGYNPRGAACTTTFNANKYCNLGPSFDFSGSAGDQDGLLPTASPLLGQCWADWSGLQGNVPANNKIFDITGNLREITKGAAANTYPVMGGAFTSAQENGATCQFSFYTVDQSFQLFDLGFRCCFSADPG
jgi:hypothetical protein